MNPYLNKFIPLVDFLAEVLGKDTEVALHDFSNFNSSIVAIKNNHISGRQLGAPATNLVLKVMNNHIYSEKDYEVNYKGISATGKILKSSSYFIKDDKKNLVGMLCINMDMEKYKQFRDFLSSILPVEQERDSLQEAERFSSSTEELTLDLIESAINSSGILPERMSMEEKIQIIKQLHENGVFLIKGSVNKVAIKLKISEASVYRYLNKISKGVNS